MEKVIEQIRLKADACGDSTKEQKARKGAYVDCLVLLKEALRKHAVSGSVCEHLHQRWEGEYPHGSKRVCQVCGEVLAN